MLNDSCFGFSIGVSVDWLSSRFIAFRLPAGQDKKGQCDCLALSFVERSRFYHPLFVHDKNGLLFNNNSNLSFFKVDTF